MFDLDLDQPRMEISVTRIRTYLLCPEQYRYRYVHKAEPEFVSAAMLFGDCLHQALAEFHRSKNTLEWGQVYDRFIEAWTANAEHAERIGCDVRFKSQEESDLMTKAQSLLSQYCDQFATLKADDVELPFEQPLLDPLTGAGDSDIRLVGKIDLVAENSIYEFKTSARSFSQTEADESIQMTAYSAAYEYLYGEKPEHLYIVALVKTKEPKIQMIETTRTDIDTQRFMDMAVGVAQAIESTLFYRNLEYQYGCPNCEHFGKCLGKRF